MAKGKEIFNKYRTLIVGVLIAIVTITGMSLKDVWNDQVESSNIKSIGAEAINDAVRISGENKVFLTVLTRKIDNLEKLNISLKSSVEENKDEIEELKGEIKKSATKIDDFNKLFTNYLITVTNP